MARNPEEREDLLREATAYVNRIQLELSIEGLPTELFAGFRECGAASFYLGQDPVYHFNTTGKLRRAFVQGKICKAEAGLLVFWTRQNLQDQVAMVRTDLNELEQGNFCLVAEQHLKILLTAITSRDYTVVGEVSNFADMGVVDLLEEHLRHLSVIQIADSPRVDG